MSYNFRIWRDDVDDNGEIISFKTDYKFPLLSLAIDKIHELECDEYGVWFYYQTEKIDE